MERAQVVQGAGPSEARTRGEGGFALLMALMALVLLTAIGLTLAATTATEVQVAANYRWSLQATYNAHAGIEIARTILAQGIQNGDWKTVLPARAGTWDGATDPGVKATIPGLAVFKGTRNFENWQCDRKGNGMGNGVIVDDGSPTGLENVTAWPNPGGQPLNGSFTVWARRPVLVRGQGDLQDYDNTDHAAGEPPVDVLVVLAEGVAPAGATTTTRAVQYVEVTIYPAVENVAGRCGQPGGQTGNGPGNANVDTCTPLGGKLGGAAPGGLPTQAGQVGG